MKRVLIILLTIAIVLPLSYAAHLFTHRATILAQRLETTLGVPVSIAGIDVSRSQLVIRDLAIENFAASRLDKALTVDAITVDFTLRDLFSSPTTVNSIVIQDPMIAVEMYNPSGSKNNWQRILQNVGGSSNGEGAHQYLIGALSMKNLRVRAYNPALGDKIIEPAPIPSFEARNISPDNPIDLRALIALIAQAILREIGGLPGLQ
jgi:hypothetical protein